MVARFGPVYLMIQGAAKPPPVFAAITGKARFLARIAAGSATPRLLKCVFKFSSRFPVLGSQGMLGPGVIGFGVMGFGVFGSAG